MKIESGQYCKKGVVRMNRKYSIGLICVIALLLLVLSLGYRKQYEYTKEQVRISKEEEEILSVQGDVSKEESYYLKSLNGYVVVYLEDQKTIFEYTDIHISELPKQMQEEIEQGKHIKGLKKLYGFLENYSS